MSANCGCGASEGGKSMTSEGGKSDTCQSGGCGTSAGAKQGGLSLSGIVLALQKEEIAAMKAIGGLVQWDQQEVLANSAAFAEGVFYKKSSFAPEHLPLYKDIVTLSMRACDRVLDPDALEIFKNMIAKSRKVNAETITESEVREKYHISVQSFGFPRQLWISFDAAEKTLVIHLFCRFTIEGCHHSKNMLASVHAGLNAGLNQLRQKGFTVEVNCLHGGKTWEPSDCISNDAKGFVEAYRKQYGDLVNISQHVRPSAA